MPKTKAQKVLRLAEEARLESEKEDEEQVAAEMEKDPQDKVDEDPTGTGGQDDDNPIKHTSKLNKDFETLLWHAFNVKNDHHEVFEALHSEGVYSWRSFTNIDSTFIWNLTKATNGNRVPVLYQTKAMLKSLLRRF